MAAVRTSMEPPCALDVAALPQQCMTGLAVLDAALVVQWLNPALAERFGSTSRRWLGSPLAALDAGAPGLVAAATRALAARRAVVVREARVRTGEEAGLIADLAFTPLVGGGLLLELHEVATVAEAGSPALSESLRGFAHEVRNPLAGMRGAAQLLGRRVDNAELAELAEVIIGEVDRLTALADRLLRAGGKPRMAKLNVHELLERVAALVGAEACAPRVHRDYDPSLPATFADGDRLYQLLLNLARNAVEAGARTLTLRTRIDFGERLRRATLRIDVIDDGNGVPPELATTLYQPLVSGRPGGSGLGLALALEIAREHAGELRHASRPGATTFSVLLPLGAGP